MATNTTIETELDGIPLDASEPSSVTGCNDVSLYVGSEERHPARLAHAASRTTERLQIDATVQGT